MTGFADDTVVRSCFHKAIILVSAPSAIKHVT